MGVVAAVESLAGCATTVTEQCRDLIRAENEKAGTTDWLLTHTRVDPQTRYRCPWIEGYCSRTSIRAGEALQIFVSTNPPSPFVVDLYRLGYYGGKGGRHLTKLGPFRGTVQPDPPIGDERLRECAWQPCVTLTIPRDWPSGVYLGKLTAERDAVQSYVIFIVRDDRRCDFLFQCSDTTWAAYNRWPSQWSLYDNGVKEWYWGPNVRVSFDRPYGRYCQEFRDMTLSQGSGEFLLWEFPLAYWMEQHGYDVSYISNVDTHADPEHLLRARALLSVGHDEYWSLAMFHNVKASVARGLNVAFFSGNAVCGVLDFSPSARGAPHRVLRRIGQYGPVQPQSAREFPELLELKHNGPNEAALIGARSTFPVWGGADWICAQEKHWLFADTGMKNGDAIRGLVGWEFHGDPAEIPGLEVVARSRVKNRGGEADATATIYPGPKGNFVFNAATIWWSDGLSSPPGYLHPSAHGAHPRGPDLRVQRITQNLFRRFLA